MTQQPGQGPGQYGPQGPGGPQGPHGPQGPQSPTPYGSSPPPQYGAPQQPYPPQPGYGAQPGPYGAPQQGYPPQQYGSPQPPYAPGSGGGQPGYAQQPQFAAPQQPYGAQQGQPQNPYGQAPGAWSPTGGLPPVPPKKSKTGLIVAVIALVVVLAGGAGLWLALKPGSTTTTGSPSTAATTATSASASAATKATTAANKATTTSKAGSGVVACSGTTVDATDYSAKIPTGWQCGTETSSLTLTDTKYDTMLVMQIPGQTDAAKVCSSLGTAGNLTALPDTQWGGKTAKTEDIVSGNTKMHIRCVAAANSVYYLMALPITGTYADVVSGVDGLTSGWTWK